MSTTYDPDYVGRAIDDLLKAIHAAADALERSGQGNSTMRRDVLACRALLAGLYTRLPREVIEEAGR